MIRALFLSLALLALASCWREAPATDAAGFFNGKTITYIVSTRAGGGYDTYARAITKYMARHIPGARIQVVNVPGAANIVGANQLYEAAADGLTIGGFTMGLMFSQLTAAPGVRFDLTKMSWIGKAASEPRALAVGENSGYRTLEDLRRSPKPVRLWSGPVGSPTYYSTQMLAEATGFPVQVVPGFDDEEGVMALLRGDLAGGLSSPSSVAPMLQQGLGRLVMALGQGPELAPTVVDASTVTVSPLGHDMIAFSALQAELGRVTAAPPSVPADRLEILRQAYMAAVTDPALQGELMKVGLPINPLDGPTVAMKVNQALHPSAEIMDWLRAAATR